jgi:hypothetical protein
MSGRTCAVVLLLSVYAFSQRTSTNKPVSSAARPSVADQLDNLRSHFRNPPDDSRIMMRWWWFGPAVSKRELEREMRVMKEGGIGGFEVQPVYPLALDDPSHGIKNLPYLSDDFNDALRFVSQKSRELGLRMDLTLGSGWPFGGPQVPITQAAGALRWERVRVEKGSTAVPLPEITSGEKLIAVFLVEMQGQSARADNVREVTEIRDGMVQLPADLNGAHELLFFISSRTGMMVKRPAVGAEGFVLDHYDKTAVEDYLRKVGERLLQPFGSQPPYAIFCDSLEAYQSDWTGDFLQEFQRRRGYDLKPFLPALVLGTGEKTEAVRHDWGKTLTELFNERFATPIHDWARQNHTLFRMQGYGIPPAGLSTNALADLPEGEGWQWKTLSATRWASSAGHLYGRPVTSSETWTWLHSPVFRATPLDMKAEADLHFLEGINQLIGHGWPYTPEGVQYPGWRFYAAAVFDEKNPWWIVMPDVSRYLQRLSFLLRQGQPVNDIAIYLPNGDAWAHFSPGHVNLIETLRERIGPDVVARVLESGFNFDFFDDDALKQAGRIEKSLLEIGPNHYRAVILPNVESIPVETYKKLGEFAKNGGVLIATRRLPAKAPGFGRTQDEERQIQNISQELFEGQSPAATFVEDENLQFMKKLTGLLQPDVSFSSSVPDIGFVHRTVGDAEIYFLANTANVGQSVNATYRAQNSQAEWWDPISGSISSAKAVSEKQPSTIQLDLEPYASRVLVFSKANRPSPIARRASHALPPAIDLSSGWQVTFPEENKPERVDHLRSWTENDETRYFSGQATYEKEMDVPGEMLRTGVGVRLDFGEGQPVPPQPLKSGMRAWFDAPVREAAVVYINDRRAGSLWCPPYSLDVSGFLRPGANKIKVIVGNLAVNNMAGHSLPDYRLLNLRYGARFQAQDMDQVRPVPSGLLGPIRLIPARGQQ